jgi:hypothetical protein
MVYHNKNYWVFGISPSSGILGNRKHDVSETRSVSVLRCGGKTSTQLGPLDRANLNNWTTLSDAHSYLITRDQANSAGDNQKICNKNSDTSRTCVEIALRF